MRRNMSIVKSYGTRGMLVGVQGRVMHPPRGSASALPRLSLVLIAAALFSILVFTAPPVRGDSEIILWDYTYDGETLEIELKNIGDNTARVFLSLRDDNGIIVGDPLYSMGTIGVWSTQTFTFNLEDYSQITVVFDYAILEGDWAGATDQGEELIYLSVSENTPLEVSASSPSLQAELGGTASYQIALVNAGGERYVEFAVSGLPGSIDADFYSGSQRILGATLGGGGTKSLTLRLSLPSIASGFEVGDVISFDFFALDENQAADYAGGTALENTGASSLNLYLTPEGLSEVSLSLENRFARVSPGSEIRITGTVTNTGTLVAEDLEVEAVALPYGWSAFADPDTIASVGLGEEIEVEMTVVLPNDASSGRYEFFISVSGADSAADKSFEVRVEGAGSDNIVWVLAMMVALVAVVGIMVKVRRR